LRSLQLAEMQNADAGKLAEMKTLLMKKENQKIETRE
jgi:hypothetical protein